VYASEQTEACQADILNLCPRSRAGQVEEPTMSIGTILLILLILILIGVLPTWPHARSWGYGPSGAIGVIVLILIVLVLTGRL
jgi:hypothetical protein